jgi:hypothetical protein
MPFEGEKFEEIPTSPEKEEEEVVEETKEKGRLKNLKEKIKNKLSRKKEEKPEEEEKTTEQIAEETQKKHDKGEWVEGEGFGVRKETWEEQMKGFRDDIEEIRRRGKKEEKYLRPHSKEEEKTYQKYMDAFDRYFGSDDPHSGIVSEITRNQDPAIVSRFLDDNRERLSPLAQEVLERALEYKRLRKQGEEKSGKE